MALAPSFEVPVPIFATNTGTGSELRGACPHYCPYSVPSTRGTRRARQHVETPTADRLRRHASRWLRNQAVYRQPHLARFPVQVPLFFVRFPTDPGDLVLDPFAGSNTTGEIWEGPIKCSSPQRRARGFSGSRSDCESPRYRRAPVLPPRCADPSWIRRASVRRVAE